MRRLYRIRFMPLLALSLIAVMVLPAVALAAQAPVELGTASSFAVLAGQTITNTGPTTINGDAGGDVGISATPSLFRRRTISPPPMMKQLAEHRSPLSRTSLAAPH
jgi:hypothetical protein